MADSRINNICFPFLHSSIRKTISVDLPTQIRIINSKGLGH